MPIRPEFIPADGGESRPFFEKGRFLTELSPTPEWQETLRSLRNGIVSFGTSIGVDLEQRVDHIAGRIHIFPDKAALREAVKFIDGADITNENTTGIHFEKKQRIFIVAQPENDDLRSLLIHELIHAVTHPEHGRTPEVMHEMFADLLGAHIVQEWCDKPVKFRHAYDGVGIVGDELFRKAARGRGLPTKSLFKLFAQDMFRGTGLTTHIFEAILGRDAIEWLYQQPVHQFRQGWISLAERLGLHDAIRRLRNPDALDSKMTKWIDRDYIPPDAPPLPAHATVDPPASDYIKPGSTIHIEIGSTGGSTVSEVQMTLGGVVQQLEDIQQQLLAIAGMQQETAQMLAGIFDGSDREEVYAMHAELEQAQEHLQQVLGRIGVSGEWIQTYRMGL